MPTPKERIPDAEPQVLKLLWSHGSMRARALAEKIYGVADNSTVGTVSKLLKRLHESEEECCDAWVVSMLPNERRSYGEAMIKTIEFLTDRQMLPVLAASAFGNSFLHEEKSK